MYVHRKKISINNEEISVCQCRKSPDQQQAPVRNRNRKRPIIEMQQMSSTRVVFKEKKSGGGGEQDCSFDCGVNCVNRAAHVECLAKHCPCKERCQNQRFQRRQWAKTKIRDAGAKGKGLFAAEDIPKDGFIGEYTGEVISESMMKDRMKKQYAMLRHSYFLNLSGSEMIDATARGSKTRFLNHSCAPNAVAQKWHVGAELRVGFFALCDISKGEEITIDYDFQKVGTKHQKCYCGAASCRGMIAPTPKKEKLKKKHVEERLESKKFEEWETGYREGLRRYWRETSLHGLKARPASDKQLEKYIGFHSEQFVFLRRNMLKGMEQRLQDAEFAAKVCLPEVDTEYEMYVRRVEKANRFKEFLSQK
eukprot:ANDGO_02265.mRNA.1 Histone-lysine N-methyltransferase